MSVQTDTFCSCSSQSNDDIKQAFMAFLCLLLPMVTTLACAKYDKEHPFAKFERELR